MVVSPQRRAFTLLELILVLAVVIMIMAAAIPSIQGMLDSAKLQEATDHLRSRFAEARSHAIEEGRPYRFAIMPDQGDYRLAPDTPDYWDDSQTTIGSGSTTNSALVVEAKLPSNILFEPGNSMAGGSGGWSTLVTFLPDGSCDNDCTVTLRYSDLRPAVVSVRALTGSVTVGTLNEGNP